MPDILVECSASRLGVMLALLKDHLPRCIQQYNYIYNYLYHYDRISGKRDSLYSDRWNARFYTHRQGEMQNCTLIVITEKKDYTICCFTLQESLAELKECLQKTKRIDWTVRPLDVCCDEVYFEEINKLLCQTVSNEWVYPAMEHIMYISSKAVAQLPLTEKLPNDMYVAPLDPVLHSRTVNDHWDYASQNSLCLIRQSLEMNGGIGLFRRGNDQPIAWMATTDFFTPGFLHTIKSERQKGYGQLVSKLELKRMVKNHGIDMFTFVTAKNVSSLALHRKIGFESVNTIRWLQMPLYPASL